ncbi:MAG: helix-turn-helix transcriptional regulator [Chloroflexi bacterium]|nr:helix-turn-helix transcriptional regulator [Chloroflexota bacterium]
MSVATRWNTHAYQRIASASYREQKLTVCFEDGAQVSVTAQQVLPPHTREVDWEHMTFNSYEVVVPTASGQIEIPWSAIRALTDDAYRAHLAAAAEEQAREIGRRLRELRKSRHLSREELAERVGIPLQRLTRIEQGRHAVNFTTLRQLLAPMGYSLKDLVMALPDNEGA